MNPMEQEHVLQLETDLSAAIHAREIAEAERDLARQEAEQVRNQAETSRRIVLGRSKSHEKERESFRKRITILESQVGELTLARDTLSRELSRAQARLVALGAPKQAMNFGMTGEWHIEACIEDRAVRNTVLFPEGVELTWGCTREDALAVIERMRRATDRLVQD